MPRGLFFLITPKTKSSCYKSWSKAPCTFNSICPVSSSDTGVFCCVVVIRGPTNIPDQIRMNTIEVVLNTNSLVFPSKTVLVQSNKQKDSVEALSSLSLPFIIRAMKQSPSVLSRVLFSTSWVQYVTGPEHSCSSERSYVIWRLHLFSFSERTLFFLSKLYLWIQIDDCSVTWGFSACKHRVEIRLQLSYAS